MRIPHLPSIIRKLREQGMSLEKIAEQTGVSKSYIGRIARAHNITCPVELRGRWRKGKKGQTRAQWLAHSREGQRLREQLEKLKARELTEAKKAYWQRSA